MEIWVYPMNWVMLWVKGYKFGFGVRNDFPSLYIHNRVLVKGWVRMGLVIPRVNW